MTAKTSQLVELVAAELETASDDARGGSPRAPRRSRQRFAKRPRKVGFSANGRNRSRSTRFAMQVAALHTG